MSTSKLGGATALLLAPLLVLVGTAVNPTLSDDASTQATALADHRSAAIAGAALSNVAAVLLIAGTVWLAVELVPRTRGMALAGGVLGVFGSLVVLFEAGVSAAAPSIVAHLGSRGATPVLDRIHSSAAVSSLEPLSILGDIGLAVLAVALVKAGAQRATGAAIALGAFAEGAGFASGTKALVIAGFAVMFVGFVQAVRLLLAEEQVSGAGRADLASGLARS